MKRTNLLFAVVLALTAMSLTSCADIMDLLVGGDTQPTPTPYYYATPTPYYVTPTPYYVTPTPYYVTPTPYYPTPTPVTGMYIYYYSGAADAYGSMSPQYFTSGQTVMLSSNQFYRNGYSFAGWATYQGGPVTYYVNTYYTFYSEMYLYAAWTPDATPTPATPTPAVSSNLKIQRVEYGGGFVIQNPSSGTTTQLSNYYIYLNSSSYGYLPYYSLEPGRSVKIIPSGYTPLYGEVTASFSFYPSSSGCLELFYSGGSSVDAVRWGSSYDYVYGAWGGANASYASNVIVRKWSGEYLQDTDSYSDWVAVSSVQSEYEFNDTAATANLLSSTGGLVKGSISTVTDNDYFRIPGSAVGRTLYFYTYQPNGGTYLDSSITLYDAAGYQLGWDDDSGPGAYSYTSLYIAPGTDVYVKVRHYNLSGTGDYMLLVHE